VLLPCHVVVRSAEGDGVLVDFIDPAVLVEIAGEPGVRDIADEVRTRFEMLRDTVATVREVAWRQSHHPSRRSPHPTCLLNLSVVTETRLTKYSHGAG